MHHAPSPPIEPSFIVIPKVGEDNLSYGYGGTGKISANNKFFDYGEPYTSGDTLSCCIDLEASPKVILFTKNGKYLGVAFRLDHKADGQTFFPHVTVKNMRLAVNFGQREPYFPPLQGFSLLSRLPPHSLGRGSVGPSSKDQCEIIMMVGIPGSGKTVWAEKYAKDHPEKKFFILGTNTIMDKMKVMGLMRKRNYHGRWDVLIKQATDVLNKVFKIAERKNRNYILDQTNVYFSARRRKMNNFRGFRRIAAVIVTTNEVLKERTEKREREEGKVVPQSAILEMKANFVLPEVGEIFDDVWFIEEDRANSERLVAEFQREGKEFKESEKKRKPEDSSFKGNQSSGVKRLHPDQVSPSLASQHGPRDQHQVQSYCGGFHGNYNPREPGGASLNEPFHGPLSGTQEAPVRSYNDYRPPQSSGKPEEPHGTYNRYNDYGHSYRQQGNYGHSEPHIDSRYPSHHQIPNAGDVKYQANYQPLSDGDGRYQPSAEGSRYQSHYQPPNNARYQPDYQQQIGGVNSYGQHPLSHDQHGQYYGGQYHSAQSYPQGQNYYSGGVGRGQGGYDQYRYGGRY